jgi:hypothetical protein
MKDPDIDGRVGLPLLWILKRVVGCGLDSSGSV